jgi:hypothetical protein
MPWIGILRVREGEVGWRKPGNAQWKKKLEIRGKDGRKWRLWLRIKWDGEASSRYCAPPRSERTGWWWWWWWFMHCLYIILIFFFVWIITFKNCVEVCILSSRGCVVGIVTRLRAGRSGTRIPVRAKEGLLKSRVTKSSTTSPNIRGLSLWKSLHVIQLAPRFWVDSQIFRKFLYPWTKNVFLL